MNLLATGAFAQDEKELFPFKEIGFGNVYFQKDERAELIVDPKLVDVVICNGLFLYHDVDQFTNLKAIQLTSAGLDRVPVERIRELGIKLFNARGVYSVPMAEYALGVVLNIYKNFPFFHEKQQAKTWEKRRDLRELNGQTVCVVGAGSVGTEVAKRFKAFDTKVIGVDVVTTPRDPFDKIEPIERLSEAVAEADVVVATLPLTEQTRGLFDADLFAKFKPGALFVNIARGAVVKENALIEALRENRIYAAVLDVFESEPLDASSDLWNLENVLITPHISFVSQNNKERLCKLAFQNLDSWKTK